MTPTALRHWRLRRKLTQLAAAKELGVGLRTYSRWELGQAKSKRIPRWVPLALERAARETEGANPP